MRNVLEHLQNWVLLLVSSHKYCASTRGLGLDYWRSRRGRCLDHGAPAAGWCYWLFGIRTGYFRRLRVAWFGHQGLPNHLKRQGFLALRTLLLLSIHGIFGITCCHSKHIPVSETLAGDHPLHIKLQCNTVALSSIMASIWNCNRLAGNCWLVLPDARIMLEADVRNTSTRGIVT